VSFVTFVVSFPWPAVTPDSLCPAPYESGFANIFNFLKAPIVPRVGCKSFVARELQRFTGVNIRAGWLAL